MNERVRYGVSGVFLVALYVTIFIPLFVRAQATATQDPSTGEIKITMSDKANAMCTPVFKTCACGFDLVLGRCVPNGKNKYQCPPSKQVCFDTDASGKYEILGTCVDSFKCEAKIAPGLGGGGNVLDSTLGQLGQLIGDVLKQLTQGSPGGGGSGGAPSGSNFCPNGYYEVDYVSSDPCATYVPSTSSQLGTGTSFSGTSGADALLSALSGSNSTDTSSPTVTIHNVNTNTNTNENTNTQTTINTLTGTTSTSTGITVSGTGFPVSLTPLNSSTGDIRVTGTGATVVAGQTDSQTNTTVSGFYGSDTFGTQEPQSLAAQMCRNRPWASNFLSVVIPTSFFDGLCTWRGYQVGQPEIAQPILQQTPVQQAATKPAATTTTQTPVSTVPPKVDIWAVPDAVPLATRTTIYWNTQGVSNCVTTSSGGNFYQTSVSGGAATVPLTSATTFTILCTAPDGSEVTASTVVDIAI